MDGGSRLMSASSCAGVAHQRLRCTPTTYFSSEVLCGRRCGTQVDGLAHLVDAAQRHRFECLGGPEDTVPAYGRTCEHGTVKSTPLFPVTSRINNGANPPSLAPPLRPSNPAFPGRPPLPLRAPAAGISVRAPVPCKFFVCCVSCLSSLPSTFSTPRCCSSFGWQRPPPSLRSLPSLPLPVYPPFRAPSLFVLSRARACCAGGRAGARGLRGGRGRY